MSALQPTRTGAAPRHPGPPSPSSRPLCSELPISRPSSVLRQNPSQPSPPREAARAVRPKYRPGAKPGLLSKNLLPRMLLGDCPGPALPRMLLGERAAELVSALQPTRTGAAPRRPGPPSPSSRPLCSELPTLVFPGPPRFLGKTRRHRGEQRGRHALNTGLGLSRACAEAQAKRAGCGAKHFCTCVLAPRRRGFRLAWGNALCPALGALRPGATRGAPGLRRLPKGFYV